MASEENVLSNDWKKGFAHHSEIEDQIEVDDSFSVVCRRDFLDGILHLNCLHPSYVQGMLNKRLSLTICQRHYHQCESLDK